MICAGAGWDGVWPFAFNCDCAPVSAEANALTNRASRACDARSESRLMMV